MAPLQLVRCQGEDDTISPGAERRCGPHPIEWKHPPGKLRHDVIVSFSV